MSKKYFQTLIQEAMRFGEKRTRQEGLAKDKIAQIKQDFKVFHQTKTRNLTMLENLSL